MGAAAAVSGLSAATAATCIQALTHFSEFLAVAAPGVDLAGIDRPLLERYLAWLTGLPGGSRYQGTLDRRAQQFFQAIRRYGWDDTLPATAGIFTGDSRAAQPRLTRHLAEYVMAQVEEPANLTAGRPRRPASHPDPDPVRAARIPMPAP